MIKNMEEMGWGVRLGSRSDTYVVTTPDAKTATLNLRSSGHGTGLDNLRREIRSLGYVEAWRRYQDVQAAERAQKLEAAKIPTPAQVFPAHAEPAPEPAAESEPAMPGRRFPEVTEASVRVGEKWLKIEGRGPAKSTTPVTGSELVKIDGVEEILLEDGMILYRCTRSPRTCMATFEYARQVISHMRSHGTVSQVRAEERAFAQRSAAGRIGRQVARERRELLVGDETRAAWLVGLVETMEAALPVLKEMARLKVEVGVPFEDATALMDEVEALRAKVEKLEAAHVPEDELAALRNDAENFRTAQRLFGKK